MKKIKKFIFSIFIVALFATTLTAASSAATVKMIFSDISKTAWYYESVLTLTRSDIISGYPDGLFKPDKDITTAEFTKIIVLAIGGKYNPEIEYIDQTMYNKHWANKYIDEALNFGYIDMEELESRRFIPDAPISRSYMVTLLLRALGLPPIQTHESPFADEADGYALAAYNEYILRGYVDGNGVRTFHGDNTASRAEASEIVVRALDYLRDPAFFRANAIFRNADNNVLNTEFELIDLFTAMNEYLIKRMSFKCDLPIETVHSYYRLANAMFAQHFYGSYISFYYNPTSDRYTIELEYTKDENDIFLMKTETERAVREIVSALVNDKMNDYEKLFAIHDYLVLNCRYDYDNYLNDTIPLESYLAYGALIEGVAVCQGYSAAFNMLCREAGIPSLMIAGTNNGSDYANHAWNMVLVDGDIFYFDVTSDDPVPDVPGNLSQVFTLMSAYELAQNGYVWAIEHVRPDYFTLARIDKK